MVKKDAVYGLANNQIDDQILLGAVSRFVFVTAPGTKEKVVAVAIDAIHGISTKAMAPNWSVSCVFLL